MAGVRITQQEPTALPGRRYGSFASKTAATTHPVANITRLWPYGGPGHLYGSFAGKTAAPVGADSFIPTYRRRRR